MASIVERQQKFLLVRESVNAKEVYNQPAGHWEQHESLLDAVIRETLEETGWQFIPRGLVGIYQWTVPESQVTYLRVCFHGEVQDHDASRELDEGIMAAEWLSYEEIMRHKNQLRSPLVRQCLDDYRAGKSYPLQILKNLDN